MTNEERAKDMASKLFDAIAIRVDQFFKARNIQGGVRCGDDLFSPMDNHELAKSLLAYADDIRHEVCSEIYEEIRQAGETAIEVGDNPSYIRGLYKALQLVDIISKD